MSKMQVTPVDERDSSWEDPRPRFRVYLHTSGPDSTLGSTDTYDISGADVLQVIDWAQRQAGGVLTYAVALVRDDERRPQGKERGLVWLVGMDGNDAARSADEADRQSRMLARRRDPVGIPPRDRTPEGVPDAYDEGARS
jgi:hypothetical protein